jgi:hypothetical protein
MTKHTIPETAALKALLSETSNQQILAKMLGFVADRLMALDVDYLCGAGAQPVPHRVFQVVQLPGFCGKKNQHVAIRLLPTQQGGHVDRHENDRHPNLRPQKQASETPPDVVLNRRGFTGE